MTAPFFDTNILIDWFKDFPQPQVEFARYNQHRISRIAWTEVLAGEPPETRDYLRELMTPFEVVEVDARIARAAAGIRYRTGMKLFDALILGTARVNEAILVTRNTRDFPATMPGIRVPYTL